jgi:hypothetical protein
MFFDMLGKKKQNIAAYYSEYAKVTQKYEDAPVEAILEYLLNSIMFGKVPAGRIPTGKKADNPTYAAVEDLFLIKASPQDFKRYYSVLLQIGAKCLRQKHAKARAAA